jgi:hypothetical protein
MEGLAVLVDLEFLTRRAAILSNSRRVDMVVCEGGW